MRYAIFCPNFGPFGDVETLVDLASTAEQAGWDGMFLWDHINWNDDSDGPVVDVWVALAAIACATERLRFGTVITPIPRRRPWKLARETVTLDRLSKGRLTIGVGLGSPAEMELAPFGEETDMKLRAQVLDEGLEVLTGLWSGEEFSFSGEQFQIDPVTFRPPPLQRPRIPIWCGGWWPNRRPYRRAARWDGVIPELVGGRSPSPSDIVEIHEYIAEYRESTDPFDIVVSGYSGDDSTMAPPTEYAAAGVTWWLERFDSSRLFSVDGAKGRILAGPPGQQ